MPDLYLNFMKPNVWNALVLAVIFVGMALVILRLMKDRAVYDIQQRRRATRRAALSEEQPGDPFEQPSESSPVSPEASPKPAGAKPTRRQSKPRKRSR